MALARIARFYGLNPLALPEWFLPALSQAIEPIRNEEAIYQALAVRVASLTKDGWQKALEHFRYAARLQPERPKVVMPASEEARLWFVDNGIDTIQ